MRQTIRFIALGVADLAISSVAYLPLAGAQ
jgi:hypothetical protein